jgi:two-component system, sensor histidine kinase
MAFYDRTASLPPSFPLPKTPGIAGIASDNNPMTIDGGEHGCNRIQRMAVLIDDEPLVLKGLSLVMEQLGWAVVAAESVEEALRRLIRQPDRPALVIADYRLRGGRTGVEAILSIRSVYGADVPAFLLTGDTYPDRLREALRSGFTLLHKPISFGELTSQLAAMAAG